jgi:hypothetical protein
MSFCWSSHFPALAGPGAPFFGGAPAVLAGDAPAPGTPRPPASPGAACQREPDRYGYRDETGRWRDAAGADLDPLGELLEPDAAGDGGGR